MPLDTAVNLVDALRQIRLLEPEQLSELSRDLLPRFAEPRALAGELIRRGWLTPYQVNQLLQGRGSELLLGSYVLLERIGEGGMGQVFKAKNWKLGRLVALKLIRKERLASEDAVRRFHREIHAAAQLSHPHIIMAYDADEVNGTHFFAMEYAEGSDLAKLIKEQGPMPVAQACDCVRQAALGLQHAHERGMVHRDIKPHNLLLTKHGVVKILDMGLARLRAGEEGEASAAMTQEGAVMGTPDYMAPEQAEESHTVDLRADLYSLGCTLYHLLTGTVPFPGGSLIQKLKKHQFEQPVPVEARRPDVPAAVAALVRKLMATRPEDRYQTPAELIRALEALGSEDSRTVASGVPAGPAVTAMHDTVNEALDFRPTDEAAQAMRTDQRSRLRVERQKLLLAAVGGGVLLLGLAVALWLVLGRSGRPGQPVAGEPSKAAQTETPSFDQWLREVDDLPAEAQVAAVTRKLRERNPGFDGKVDSKIEDGAVARLQFFTDDVTDLSPVRALPGLKDLDCSGRFGKGKLADLSPLRGMRLMYLECAHAPIADLSPLKGMPLKGLIASHARISDVSPLKGMPLTHLALSYVKLDDLTPLEGMPLQSCYFDGSPKLTDLSPLKGMPMVDLRLSGPNITSLEPLRGMPLQLLYCGSTAVSDLSPLKGAPLTILVTRGTKVRDLSPLKDMPLQELICDFEPKRDAEILRSIPTLKTINGKPAAEFWKEVGDPPASKP